MTTKPQAGHNFVPQREEVPNADVILSQYADLERTETEKFADAVENVRENLAAAKAVNTRRSINRAFNNQKLTVAAEYDRTADDLQTKMKRVSKSLRTVAQQEKKLRKGAYAKAKKRVAGKNKLIQEEISELRELRDTLADLSESGIELPNLDADDVSDLDTNGDGVVCNTEYAEKIAEYDREIVRLEKQVAGDKVLVAIEEQLAGINDTAAQLQQSVAQIKSLLEANEKAKQKAFVELRQNIATQRQEAVDRVLKNQADLNDEISEVVGEIRTARDADVAEEKEALGTYKAHQRQVKKETGLVASFKKAVSAFKEVWSSARKSTDTPAHAAQNDFLAERRAKYSDPAGPN